MCISDTHVRYGLKFGEVISDCMSAFSWPLLVLYTGLEDSIKYRNPMTDSDLIMLQREVNNAQFEL